MHHVKHESDYITSLGEEEILNPYEVLNEAFKDRASPSHKLNELFDLLTLVIRKNFWMAFESPLILYKNYKTFIRLFEAGSLIGKIRPDLHIQEKLCIPYQKIALDTPDSASDILEGDPIVKAYQTLVSVFNSDPIYSLKSDLFSFIYQGLRPTCSFYPYEFSGYEVNSFQQMSSLIIALHKISHHERNNLLSSQDLEVLEKERTQFRAKNTFHNYRYDINNLYRFSQKGNLTNAIRMSKVILSTDNFWKLHNNPANLLHYFHDFLFVLDCYWLRYQEIVDMGLDLNTKWEYPKKIKKALLNRGCKWFKKPWRFLNDQFEKRSIGEWHIMLESCLECVLSNRRIEYAFNRSHYEVLDFIEDLIVLEGLSEYEPLIQ